MQWPKGDAATNATIAFERFGLASQIGLSCLAGQPFILRFDLVIVRLLFLRNSCIYPSSRRPRGFPSPLSPLGQLIGARKDPRRKSGSPVQLTLSRLAKPGLNEANHQKPPVEARPCLVSRASLPPIRVTNRASRYVDIVVDRMLMPATSVSHAGKRRSAA